jgi:fibro-slime domain-containing protein
MVGSKRGMVTMALPVLVALSGCGSTAHDGQSTFDPNGALLLGTADDAGATTSASGIGLGGGPGNGSTSADGSTSGGCGGAGGFVTVSIRDFQMHTAGGVNPDFENASCCLEPGIVLSTLGADQKPVYGNHPSGTLTTHGKMWFDQWYNDTPGVNIHVQYPVKLTLSPTGACGYDSLVSGVPTPGTTMALGWFPIDDGTPYATMFGNQGEPHNYSFTTELHTVFTYNGGETFSFSGDDDVFVFIDGTLAIDLGGVHVRTQQAVSLDTLGLTVGHVYPLDLFNAERKTVQSNFSFTTTLQLQAAPPR